MLRRIRLKNFQCYKRFDLTCENRVTFIRGKSDSGKSAIVRALKWVLFNSISGTGFIRQGQTEVMVSCEFDDSNDLVVTRRRTASKNIYRMQFQLDGKEFKKDFVSFGNTVPEPIARELKLATENLQSQHDAPFWLSLSDTQAAAQLNSIVRLEAVDRSIGRLLEMRQRTVNIRSVTEKMITSATRRLSSAIRLPASRFEEAQKLIKTLDTAPIDALADLIDSIERALQTKRQAPRIKEMGALLAAADAADLELDEIVSRCDRLSQTLAQIRWAEDSVQKLQIDLTRAKKSLSEIKVCPECHQPLK